MRRWVAALGRPEVLVWAVVVVSTTVLYVTTLCPTVYWYDSAEFSAKAAALGVPHPPGYPLYTLVAHAFTWLPGEPARGVNLMSLVFGVACVALVYRFVRNLGGGWAAAVVAAAVLATSVTFWANAVVAEVYTPGLLFTLGVFVVLERAETLARPRLLLLAGLLGGLGVGMHMSIATCGLGYAWLVVSHGISRREPDDPPFRWRSALRLRRVLATLGAAIAGLLVFAYIPLRTFERWDRREWINFFKNAGGGTFRRKFLHDYDALERLDLMGGVLLDNLTVLGLVGAMVGAVVLLRRRRSIAIGLLLGAIGNVWWFFNYDVPDLDVFVLPTVAIAAVLCGLGVEALGQALERVHPRLRHATWLVLAWPLLMLGRNHDRVDLSTTTEAAEWGIRACKGAAYQSRVLLFNSPREWERYAVLLYVQEGLGRCRDVRIWKKPRIEDVQRALGEGQTIYLFAPRLEYEQRFEVIDEGGLLLVRRKPGYDAVGS